MISVDQALEIHRILIEKFGGKTGVRDFDLLESSLFRPYNTFDSEDLYPNTVDKAAAIIESIVRNHPFIDGNKRVGYTLMRLTLLLDGLDIEADENSKYDFVMKIAEGKLTFEEIRSWIESNLKK